MAETAKPKAELKSFWEAHSPVDGGAPTTPPRRSTAENSNAGRKWQVSCLMWVWASLSLCTITTHDCPARWRNRRY